MRSGVFSLHSTRLSYQGKPKDYRQKILWMLLSHVGPHTASPQGMAVVYLT